MSASDSPTQFQSSSDYSPDSDSLPSPSLRARFNIAAWQNKPIASIQIATELPKSVSKPKYSIGTKCRWIPMPSTDWGTVIGQIFVPVEAEQSTTSQWQWCYLLLLAPDSPSHNWIIADWVNETDLELLPPQPKETPNYSGEEP